jgi:apolipoprotein N-acyltransferase
VRIIALLALAAWWVVLEWFRGWLFGGFPWLPLGASQWQRPAMLQVAAYAGAGAISFALVAFNLGSAAYAHRIFFEGAKGLRKRSPEFTAALLVLMSSVFPFIGDFFGQQRQKLARVTLVQPYIPQGEKWDASKAREILQTIEQVTFDANKNGAPDAILWPEAVTPWTVHHDPNVADWLESISHRTGKPLLLGSVFTQGNGAAEQWYNGAFVVDPIKGVQEPGYAKRKLVPFGEYVPLRPVLGWLEKVAPIGGDFISGLSAEPLVLPIGTRTVPVGVLICYEDIFPGLARESTKAGAELLAVLTNNAWFGEGGAAYQHAAHSVLRAVENRRPLVRVGNGGWSGWIDEFGVIRATVRNESGTVYFRGAETVTITRDQRWRGRFSFYGEHGDWFLALCAVLATAGYYLVVMLRPPPPRADGETAF